MLSTTRPAPRMRFPWRLSPLFLGLLLLPLSPLSATVYQVDPARSKVEVLVIRGGLLGVFGHDHEIVSWKLTGTIDYVPSSVPSLEADVSLPASSLTVVDPEDPLQERKEVQSTMRGKRVLDVDRYPEIHFTSTGASPAPTAPQILLSGDLALHGTVRRICFPVRITPAPGAIRAAGTAKVRQSDFGIEPIRFAAGTVRIKDQVEIHFTVLARERAPAAP
ncbi:YceI family protein [Methylacidimicrobium sp. B4]|uniref:YceI family protein n=1 Tax=Methylacidimicrobium sp. B4 TaxID=2796139 RepID=UPI001A8E1250|nr:YceI family protein [Methylacidimicrobium sp. B4]QSR84404.1 YceI family protein [Methylacidimicrobium sp. B4]